MVVAVRLIMLLRGGLCALADGFCLLWMRVFAVPRSCQSLVSPTTSVAYPSTPVCNPPTVGLHVTDVALPAPQPQPFSFPLILPYPL